MMAIVYIAGPFRGKNAKAVADNVERARAVAYKVAKSGHVPLCTHSMYSTFDGTLTDKFWLEATMKLLKKADVVLMMPGWEKSAGSRAERDAALRMGMPVLYHEDKSEGLRNLDA